MLSRSLFFFFFTIFFTLSSFGQNVIQVGKLVDSIPVSTNDSLQETFSLYLPHNFDKNKKMPVLLVFDPKGRGANSVQLFRNIAEQQSYIIAGSNTPLEDSLQYNVSKAMRLLRMLVTSVPVDTSEIYVAGMGKGAQVATAIPVIYPNIQGVLAVGDAWANPDLLSKKNRFIFSAIAGDKDAAIYTLQAYVDYFNKIGFQTEINYFDGGEGEWPPSKVLSNAVSGFTLSAIAKGYRNESNAFIDSLYKNEVAFTERLRRKREYYRSYEKLKQMQNKYSLLERFDDDLKGRVKDLRRNSAFRKQRREFRREKIAEDEKRENFLYYMDGDVYSANFDNLGWWEYQQEELEKQSKEGNLLERKTALRLLSYLKELAEREYAVVTANENSAIDNKVFVNVLLTIFDKENPQPYLNIIRLSGHDGDYYTALLYLEDLLKTGYKDYESLYNIKGILDLKLSKDYNETIKKYLGKSKYYDE